MTINLFKTAIQKSRKEPKQKISKLFQKHKKQQRLPFYHPHFTGDILTGLSQKNFILCKNRIFDANFSDDLY